MQTTTAPAGRPLTILALALVLAAVGTGVQARDTMQADATAEVAIAVSPPAGLTGGCQAAGDGPCCTSCREKAGAAAEPKGECPCQRAKRLREAARAQQQ